MIVGMVFDVAKFMALFAVVLLGFASALAHLISEEDVRHAERPDGASPGICPELLARGQDMRSGVMLLFEGALFGDISSELLCMQDMRNARTGTILLYVFLIFSILLLLNMIIAIMGQTFAEFYSSAKEEGALYFSRVVMDWEDQKDLTPPFNLLVLPSRLLLLICQVAFRICTNICNCLTCGLCAPTYKRVDDPAHAAPLAHRRVAHATERKGPGDAPSIHELRDAIADNLHTMFGAWVTTDELVQDAATSILAEVRHIQERLPTEHGLSFFCSGRKAFGSASPSVAAARATARQLKEQTAAVGGAHAGGPQGAAHASSGTNGGEPAREADAELRRSELLASARRALELACDELVEAEGKAECAVGPRRSPSSRPRTAARVVALPPPAALPAPTTPEPPPYVCA